MAISTIYVGPNSPKDIQSCNLVAIGSFLSSAATNVFITPSSAEAGKGYNSTTPATSPVVSEPFPPLEFKVELCKYTLLYWSLVEGVGAGLASNVVPRNWSASINTVSPGLNSGLLNTSPDGATTESLAVLATPKLIFLSNLLVILSFDIAIINNPQHQSMK